MVGCAANTGTGGANSDQAGPSTAQGGRIWSKTCMRCHSLRPAEQFEPDEWPVILAHMRSRADLTKSQAADVAAFLQMMASR